MRGTIKDGKFVIGGNLQSVTRHVLACHTHYLEVGFFAQAGPSARRTLLVGINQQNFVALVSEIGRDVDGEGCFAHTTFLVQERNDHSHTLHHLWQCVNVEGVQLCALLPATSCDDLGVLCTRTGKRLSNAIAWLVPGP